MKEYYNLLYFSNTSDGGDSDLCFACTSINENLDYRSIRSIFVIYWIVIYDRKN